MAKTREAYSTMNSAAKDGVKVLEDVMVTPMRRKDDRRKNPPQHGNQRGGRVRRRRAISGAANSAEVVRLQTSFLQSQFAIASAQTKELFELSTKVAEQTFETMNSATTRTFEQIRKAR